MVKKTKKELKADQEILDKAIERYEICVDACDEIYKDAISDKAFSAGEQWSSKTTADRIDRPCLVENRLAGMIHQVCNDQRQNRPMMKVSPVDNNSDPDTAKVINGFLRHIQYSSDSETAFDTAFEDAVRGGIGWYRLITDYTDDESFDQEIILKRIDNLQSVKAPLHFLHEIDFRDMPYCFVEETISKEEFEELYPNATEENWNVSTDSVGWIDDEEIKICEYFVVEKKPYTLYKLSTGEIVKEMPEGAIAIDERIAYDRKIKWYKITHSQILERGEIPGKWIPVFPVIGEEVIVNGKRKYISLTRGGKDPQKMLNYWRSAEAERISLAPKQKFIVATNQIEGYEGEWSNANKSNNPVLHYNPTTEGGVLVPPPQQLAPTQMDMAIVNAARESVDAIKACTGIFDASLGAESNEKSGRAIMARQREGDTSNFHFFDNFAKSMRHCCRVIVDMIPEVYDTERAIRILGEDMKQEVVTVNKEYSADGKLYDLSVGKYDVMVETGPSYLSKRQETVANLKDLGQNDPVIIESSRDLIAKYSDLPAEIVERLNKTIDPNLLSDDQKQDPRALQAQLVQAQQQLQQLDQVIQAMSAELEQANAKVQGKDSDNQTRLLIAQLQAQSNEKIAALQAEIKLISEKIKSDLTETGRAHEVGIESMRHAHNIVQREIEGNRAEQDNKSPQRPAANAEV